MNLKRGFEGKIFGIGFQKTGTTTLDYALRHFGYRVVGYRPEILNQISINDYSELKKIVSEADVFQDNPWPVLYNELDRFFPNSKFILTIRDSNEWYKSMVKHFNTKESAMRKWIYGFGSPIGHEEEYKTRFTEHNGKILDYFKNRPNDLLVLDWSKGHGWPELCEFLDLQVPDIDFPKVNTAGQRNIFRGSLQKAKRNKILRKIFNKKS